MTSRIDAHSRIACDPAHFRQLPPSRCPDPFIQDLGEAVNTVEEGMRNQGCCMPDGDRIVAVLVLLLGVGAIPAIASAPPSRLWPAWRDRQEWNVKASRSEAEGNLAAAVSAVVKILDIERRMFGPVHEDVAASLARLGALHENRDDFESALQARREALRLRTRLYGPDHWRTADDRRALSDAEWLKKAPPAMRHAVIHARIETARALDLGRQGKAREGLNHAKESLEVRRRTLGENHPAVAESFSALGGLYKDTGDLARSESFHRKARAIRLKILGERHPDYTATLDQLRAVYAALGEQSLSTSLARKAEELRKLAAERTGGVAVSEAPPVILLRQRDRLKQRAETAWKAGKQVEAVLALQQALAIERRIFGTKHMAVVTTLNQLASWQEKRNQWREVVACRADALEATERLYGPTNWRTVDARWNWRIARTTATLPTRQQEALQRAEKDDEESARLYQEGTFAEAMARTRAAQETRKIAFGEKHPTYASSLNNLAEYYQVMGNHRQALLHFRQALEIQKEVLGEKHPDHASTLNNLAVLYQKMGEYRQALPLMRQSLRILRDVRGEEHPHFASTLNNLAFLHEAMGEYHQAFTLYQKALAIQKEVLGEKHPDYASTLNNLAILYQGMADYKAALPYSQKALALTREALGEKHPNYSSCLNNLAFLYRTIGDYRAALPLYQQALKILKEVLGEKHPHYASSLNNLAGLYEDMGDYKGALPLYQQAMKIQKEVLGEKHPHYASSLNNLAWIHETMGDSRAALALRRQAMVLYKDALGTRHPTYAACLDNLARLHRAMGNLEEALPLCKQALTLRREILGEKHPDVATSLENLAGLQAQMGNLEVAFPLRNRAVALRKAMQGSRHPEYAASLNALALLYHQLKKPAEALRCSEESLAITFALLRDTAAVQSERQQLVAARHFRHHLDLRLSLVGSAGEAADAYRHVLASKGAVLFLQQQRRLTTRLISEGSPEVRRQAQELQEVTRSLASLALAPVDPGAAAARHEKMEKLFSRREDLQRSLTSHGSEFRRLHQQVSPADVAAALPDGVVLVDYLFFTHTDATQTDPRKGERVWLTAFVLRRGSPVTRIDLGEGESIASDIAAWRRSVLRGGTGDDVSKRLRQRLWQPVARHTEGAKVVLISPDGALGTLSFAALPGSKADTYLIEEMALAVVPVPSAIPQMMKKVDRSKRLKPALLVAGGLRYDPEDSTSAPLASTDDRSAPRTGHERYSRLPATELEMLAVRASFAKLFKGGAVTALTEGEATKAVVRKALGRARYAHLATHGYFAPETIRSPVDTGGRNGTGNVGPLGGWHPLLLSGLVLSNANRVPGPGEEDSILTALEVSEMDLSKLELAALSACETGLGKVAGGEGLLGMQRAFQIAGARTVLASLWKVGDRATQQLMAQFYASAWDTRTIISRAEALRQAQRAMLKNGVRGIVPKVAKVSRDVRLSPLYWAGFVLSGDWR